MKSNTWVSFGVKCIIGVGLLIGWSVWDSQRRNSDLAALQEALNGKPTAQSGTESPQIPLIETENSLLAEPASPTEQSAGSDAATELAAFNSEDEDSFELTGETSPIDSHDDDEPSAPFDASPTMTNQLLNTFGKIAEGLLKTTFRDHCFDLQNKGQFELTLKQEDEILELFEYVESVQEEYFARLDIAHYREATMFQSEMNWTNTQSLMDIIHKNRRSFSARGKTIWKNYIASYEQFRSDATVKVYGGMDVWQFSRATNLFDLRQSISKGNLSYCELLAFEGYLRFLRHELETIWLGDIMIQTVVAEIPEAAFERLDTSLLSSVLRPEELRLKFTICETKNNRLHLDGDEESILDKEEREESREPNAETKQEFARRMAWLKHGPESAKIESAINKFVAIRGDKIEYEWPESMAGSIFGAGPRPTFDNPFE